jgi:tetratricopeptide (TPR) repeat protein
LSESGSFRFDHRGYTAAAELRPEHFSDFMRLVKTLRYGSASQLLVAEFDDVPYRDGLIARVDGVAVDAGMRVGRFVLSDAEFADFEHVEHTLFGLSESVDVLQVTGAESWFDSARWEAFNVRREAVTGGAPLRLVLWLTAAQIKDFAIAAPDLWAWRSGVFSFRSGSGSIERTARSTGPLRLPLPAAARRIGELRAWLDSVPPPEDETKASLLDELATLLANIGELDEALRIRREETLPVIEKLGDVRSRAVTLGKIADVLQARGELDEALRIRREEELPVYETLGDVRSRAVTLGKIADVLQARGELDEALRIRREDELPVYETLGDVRSRAMTLGKIADVLQARGELDEALRIRREETLPVFEKLGDVRSRAVTLGQIADVLEARGELDEALRIRRDEELPVYEKLGDVHSRAVTLGQIADVLQARGELDEALRIRREETLPVFEKLGDVRSRAVTLGQIAVVLEARGELDEALRLWRESLTLLQRLGNKLFTDYAEDRIAALEAERSVPPPKRSRSK